MKNIVIGSFLGAVFAATLLAACGSEHSDGGGGPPPAVVSGAVRWTPFTASTVIATGIDLAPGGIWSSTATWENGGAARNRFAGIEIRANAEGASPAVVQVGVLPALNGVDFATEPEWLGQVELRPLDNRRATLTGVRVPPSRCRLALRLASGGSVRVLGLAIAGYNEQLP